MKWTRCDGRSLTVRDVGPVLLRLVPADPRGPLKVVDAVEPDDDARDRVRALLAAGVAVKGEV